MKRGVKIWNAVLSTALAVGVLPPAWTLPAAHAAETGRKALDVSKTLTAPVIDGKLDETFWSISQPLNAAADGGQAAPRTSKFGMLWDNQYLYVGVQAEDDTPISGASGYWFEQDNVNVFLDPTLHQSAPFGKDDMQIGFTYQEQSTTPGFNFGAALNNHSGKDEKKILRAMSKTASGWSVEAAISWDMLNMNPALQKQLGLNISATDRYAPEADKQRTGYWSAYNNAGSFWNDTTGYGLIRLQDAAPVSGQISPVLLSESFDGTAAGSLPPGWISDVNAGSNPMTVVKDTYGNGRLLFDGSASGKQARVFAPVQWDNYSVEADVYFEKVLDTGRWASLIFRGASGGKPPYNQMAVRLRGTYEVAYRKPDNGWNVIATGESPALSLNTSYRWKVRVFDNNVKEYIKGPKDADYRLLIDKSFTADLLERGKIGFQADQSKVSFDNLKVTRLTADQLTLQLPGSVEALSGPIAVTGNVYYSDQLNEAISADRIKLTSFDESVIKVVDNKLQPIKPGKAKVQALYGNAEAIREVTVTPSLIGVKATSLKHTDGYLLAEAGTALDLGKVTLQAEFNDLTSGTLKGSEAAWSSEDAAVSVSGGKLSVQKKGVYPVTAEKDGAKTKLLIVAKNAGDADYVLYEENFDALADGTMPKGWTRKEGTTASAAAVKGGVFEINASASPDNPSRVLLPEYLNLFGNYKIEADVTHLVANDTARWHSLMYRIQNNDYPYYQMAVRKDATAANGVEFAERTPANAWNVMDRGSFSEAIDPAKMYHYAVTAYGNRVQETINDQVLVDTDAASAYTKGGIGLQANGSKMRVDNLRVTLRQKPLPPLPSDNFVQVTEPDTKIAMAPSVVTEVTYAADLDKWAGAALPATAILHVNEQLQVTDPSGQTVLGDLSGVLALIANRSMPAFYVKNEQIVDALVAYLKSSGLEDAFVASGSGELVKRAHAAYPMLRGIVDFRSARPVATEDLLAIRQATTLAQAKIALLSSDALSREQIAWLQQRLIFIWTQDTSGAESKLVSLHRQVASGTNGIVTDAPQQAFVALKAYSHGTTIVRKPYIIGHRGMPSKAPENTLISNEMGLDAGADFIENDMYLTKDGRLVIIHDNVLQNTTNGTGLVENFTYDQIKGLNANKPRPTGFPFTPIPTLDEQIDLARKKGKMVFAEIKTNTPEAVDAFVKVIKEKQAESVINAMSFDTNQLKRLAQQLPEMPAGILTSGYANEANVGKSLRETLKLVQGLNWTYNTSYNGVGPKFLEASKHRGIIVSPWTLNNKSDIISYFKMGVYGITTDDAYHASDWAAAIRPDKARYVLKPGESAALTATVESYKADPSEIKPELVLVQGQDVIDIDGNTVKAKKVGTAYVLLRHTSVMDANNSFDIYTEPVAITVEKEAGPGPIDPGPGTDPGTGQPQPKPDDDAHSSSGSAPSPEPKPITPVVDGKLKADGGKVDEASLKQALTGDGSLIIEFQGEQLELPASALVANGGQSKIQARNERAGYELSLGGLNLEPIAKQLQTAVQDLTVRLTVKALGGSDAAAAKAAVQTAGGKLLSSALSFQAEAVGVNGQSAAIAEPASTLKRITLDRTADPSRVTGVQYFPDTKKYRFVPTVFETRDGVTTATVKRGGGVLMVIENNVSFTDLTGHWAKSDVELLANKLVVEGVGSSRFEAERPVSRAEFAAMLVRALGLNATTAAGGFKDVAAADWFAGDVGAAREAGLIGGYEDGTFRPASLITREEQAAMLMRALKLADTKLNAPSAKTQETLGAFQDAKRIVWAQAELAAAIQAGLVNGLSADTLDPSGHATRAQSAVLLKRMLRLAGYIN